MSAVNGGIAALSKSVAEQGIQDGVQKLFEKWAGQEGLDVDEFIHRAARNLNVTRLGEPHDIAEVVAFLCREETRWMQGSIIDVDGGQNKGL